MGLCVSRRIDDKVFVFPVPSQRVGKPRCLMNVKFRSHCGRVCTTAADDMSRPALCSLQSSPFGSHRRTRGAAMGLHVHVPRQICDFFFRVGFRAT